MTHAIDTVDLTKNYGAKVAVRALNLTVAEGELFALLGVNGAGKTTTIRMLTCLTRPTSGDAVVLGDSIVSTPQAVKSKINISPQETAVARALSVRENIELIARIYGAERRAAHERTTELLEQFGLTMAADEKAKTLSGGMQRRLSIAMALISNPRILFLDEPTLGLDVLARRELWASIKRLKGRITIVLTTHYMEEAESLADRIGIMANGTMKATGTVAQLLEQTGVHRLENAFVAYASEGGVGT